MKGRDICPGLLYLFLIFRFGSNQIDDRSSDTICLKFFEVDAFKEF